MFPNDEHLPLHPRQESESNWMSWLLMYRFHFLMSVESKGAFFVRAEVITSVPVIPLLMLKKSLKTSKQVVDKVFVGSNTVCKTLR